MRTSPLCSAVSGAQPCPDQLAAAPVSLAAESLALTAKYAKTPDTSSDVNREETASLQSDNNNNHHQDRDRGRSEDGQ